MMTITRKDLARIAIELPPGGAYWAGDLSDLVVSDIAAEFMALEPIDADKFPQNGQDIKALVTVAWRSGEFELVSKDWYCVESSLLSSFTAALDESCEQIPPFRVFVESVAA